MKRYNHNAAEYTHCITPDGLEFCIDSSLYDLWNDYRESGPLSDWLALTFPDLKLWQVNTHRRETTTAWLQIEELPKLPTLAEILDVIDTADVYEFKGMDYVRGTDGHIDWTDSPRWVPTVLEPGDNASYSDFEHSNTPSMEGFYIPNLTSGSDYGNSSALEVANKRAFLEEYQSDDALIVELSGGYGSFGIAIELDSITSEMLDTFRSLEDYPVIDEDLLSEVEHEAENDAWDSWAKSDFVSDSVKALAQEPRYTVDLYMGSDFQPSMYVRSYAEWSVYVDAHRFYQILDHEAETITGKPGIVASGFSDRESAHAWLDANVFEPNWTEEHLEALTESIGDSELTGYFYELADKSNTYWENEPGNNATIDLDRIVKHVTIEDLERLAKDTASNASKTVAQSDVQA